MPRRISSGEAAFGTSTDGWMNGSPEPSLWYRATDNALVMAQNQARMDALKSGGSKKKTKHKQKYSVQHKRRVKVRVNSKKRRYTRKKDNKKHR